MLYGRLNRWIIIGENAAYRWQNWDTVVFNPEFLILRLQIEKEDKYWIFVRHVVSTRFSDKVRGWSKRAGHETKEFEPWSFIRGDFYRLTFSDGFRSEMRL